MNINDTNSNSTIQLSNILVISSVFQGSAKIIRPQILTERLSNQIRFGVNVEHEWIELIINSSAYFNP